MNLEQQLKVKEFFDEGFKIIIVNSEAHTVLLDIYQDTEDIMFATETTEDELLETVDFDKIQVFRKIENFMVLNPKAIK